MDTYAGHSARGEMDLISFTSMVWRHRWLVGITCAVCLLGAIGYLMIATPMYKAEVVLIAAHDDSMSGKSGGGSLGDQLGGLASMAGLSIGQESSTEQTADAVLESRLLAEEFVRRNDLIGVLLKKSKRPTLWRAVNVFKQGLLKIKKDQMKGTTKVTIEWTDPLTASRWANGLVALANEMLRTRARTDSSRNIEYLSHQLEGTNDVDLRKNINDIIEDQMRTLMLANGREEFAFRVVDPGVPPEAKSRPQPVLIVLVGLGLGLALGCTIAFVRARIEEHRREAAAVADWSERRIASEAGAGAASKGQRGAAAG
jgi:uncharacterized protein involved in exopolysaccharide biosynthesis